MAEINSDIIVTPNACRDVIGVRGVCDRAYPYYLDSLGISLNKAAKLADSSSNTAKQLIDESVDMAWGDVFSDLRINGFALRGVRKVLDVDFEPKEVNAGTYIHTLKRGCDIELIHLNKIELNVSGLLDVVINLKYNGLSTVIYNDSVDDEKLIITIDAELPYEKVEIEVVAIGAGTITKAGNGVLSIEAHTECSERVFYCKYWMHLVKAVMYKSAAHILNSILFSDRYNDLIIYKKDEVALRIAQLDSSFNLLNNENRINKNGLYQMEIENINRRLQEIVKQSYCSCCFECDSVFSTKISIP